MNRPIAAGLLLLILLGSGACNRTDATLSPESSEVATPTDTSLNAEASPPGSAADSTGVDAPASEDAITADHTIVPGQRVGPVTATTSRQQLADIYGEANLTDTDIYVGEGFSEPGTVVTMGSESQFAVVWLDDSRSRPLMAKDFSADWKTPEGIGVGMSYAELQQQLGDFQLYGFAWDYGGTLALEGSHLDHYYGNLLLRVEPSSASIEANPEAFQASLGDRLIPSTDPNLAQLDIAVVEMVVYLNDLVD